VGMQGNLPRVDYTALRAGRAREMGEAAIARCPTGAIVWIDEQQGDIKGADSVRVLRHSPRPRTVS
jgi:Na+-translocating ferredoxin:NAD+ oxidoreductase subunit B